LTLEESYGEGWNKPFHPDDQQRAWIAWQNATQHGATYSLECRLCRADGEYKWWLVRGVPVHDANGTVVKWFGTCTDIDELKQKERELLYTKAILQGAMDQSQAGIAIADAPDGKLRYVNDAGLLIRGGSRQEVVDAVGINQYVASWKMLDLDGTPLKPDEVPLARAIMYGETNSREFVIHRDIHDDRVVLAKAAPIKDELGVVVAEIVVFLDITESKRSETALKKSLAELKQFNDLMVGRELRMVELKQEINELLKKSGGEEKYAIHK
jgi:PAS domain-containing protein